MSELKDLIAAVEYAAELYAKPTAYRTSKGTWSMNTSIGFETRFEMLVEKAETLKGIERDPPPCGDRAPHQPHDAPPRDDPDDYGYDWCPGVEPPKGAPQENPSG